MELYKDFGLPVRFFNSKPRALPYEIDCWFIVRHYYDHGILLTVKELKEIVERHNLPDPKPEER